MSWTGAYRGQLAALAGPVLEAATAGAGTRCYPYPPDVAVAPAVFVGAVEAAAAGNGTVTLTAAVHVVTDAAAHERGRWLDDTADAVHAVFVGAGLRVVGVVERALDLNVDDDRDARPGRVLTVSTVVRPC